MRFFKNYDGFFWEFNGFGDWIGFQVARIIGIVIGYIILGILLLLAYSWLVGLGSLYVGRYIVGC